MLCLTGFLYAVHNDTAVLKKQNFPSKPSQKGLKSFQIPLTSKNDMLNTLGKGMFLKFFMKIGLRMRWLHENWANIYHLYRFE